MTEETKTIGNQTAVGENKMDNNLKDVDPFTPSNFKVNATAAAGSAMKQLTSAPVTKPHKNSFVRASNDPELSINCFIIETKQDTFLLSGEVGQALAGESFITIKNLTVSQDRQGNFFLWPTVPEVAEKRVNTWNQTGRIAKEMAKLNWVRVAANQEGSCYDVFEATADIPEPDWGNHKLDTFLRLGFHNRVITDIGDNTIQMLLGKA